MAVSLFLAPEFLNVWPAPPKALGPLSPGLNGDPQLEAAARMEAKDAERCRPCTGFVC